MKSAKETLLCALAYPGAAKDPGQEAYLTRILACESPDAKMEVYGKPLGGRHFASASASRIDFLRPGCQNAVQTNGVGMAVPPYVEITEWTLPPINRPVSVEPA
ncbi:MAG: hypothetical protein WAV78_30030 [Xanthobacteraceae bacterium]